MIQLIIISFFSGILSVLAPCVLPVLPVIFGSNLDSNDRYKPLRIIGSTLICIFIFTFLLKVSTSLINVPQSLWTRISGIIIGLYGVSLLMPHRRDLIQSRIPQAKTSGKYSGKQGDYLIGASLGPIFATCSPTYALLLGTVLPASNTLGIIGLISYLIGFGGFLYVLVLGGRSLIKKFYGVANSGGRFKRVLGIVLIITAILITSGYVKKLESVLIDYEPDLGKIEQKLVKNIDTVSYQKIQPVNEITESGFSGEDITIIDEKDESEIQNKPVRTIKPKNIDNLLLDKKYPAPEIAGLANRVNSEGYDSIKQLKGEVVLIDFWTYSCINCVHTLPHIQNIYSKYSGKGLIVLGIHAPEFQYERKIENLQKAVKEHGLTYPIAQDNDFITWKNYTNQYRPAIYLIDKEGNIVYTHFGEGEYDKTEKVIEHLLDQ